MPTVVAPSRIAIKNILVATDFSSCAQSALVYALGLAKRYGGTLYTVNVLPHFPFVESADPNPERARRTAEQQLTKLAASDAYQGVKHKEMVEQGEVARVLSEVARENQVDLIVVGTQGRTGLGKFLLGSVAEEIFRLAECPVLTVGPHASRGQFDGSLQHVLYATDFGPASVHAFPYALCMAEEHHARLTLLHVAPPPGVAPAEPEPGAMPVSDPYVAVSGGEKRLRDLMPAETGLEREPECLVQFGPAAETILRIAARDVDLVVIGAKRPAPLGKHLGGSVAYRIVCEAPCPVLSVGTRYHG